MHPATHFAKQKKKKKLKLKLKFTTCHSEMYIYIPNVALRIFFFLNLLACVH